MPRKDLDKLEHDKPDQALADKCRSYTSRLEAILKTKSSPIEKIAKQIHATKNYLQALQFLEDQWIKENGFEPKTD